MAEWCEGAAIVLIYIVPFMAVLVVGGIISDVILPRCPRLLRWLEKLLDVDLGEQRAVKSVVFFVERNHRGAWVVYGEAGVKQYYGYTKKQAVQLYKASYTIITNRRK